LYTFFIVIKFQGSHNCYLRLSNGFHVVSRFTFHLHLSRYVMLFYNIKIQVNVKFDHNVFYCYGDVFINFSFILYESLFFYVITNDNQIQVCTFNIEVFYWVIPLENVKDVKINTSVSFDTNQVYFVVLY
jgi:hypothetical protein